MISSSFKWISAHRSWRINACFAYKSARRKFSNYEQLTNWKGKSIFVKIHLKCYNYHHLKHAHSNKSHWTWKETYHQTYQNRCARKQMRIKNSRCTKATSLRPEYEIENIWKIAGGGYTNIMYQLCFLHFFLISLCFRLIQCKLSFPASEFSHYSIIISISYSLYYIDSFGNYTIEYCSLQPPPPSLLVYYASSSPQTMMRSHNEPYRTIRAIVFIKFSLI